jgi:hypothetical protein
MHRKIRSTTAIVLAATGLALVPAGSAGTRVAPPEADAQAIMLRVAPPEADALAEAALHHQPAALSITVRDNRSSITC